MSEKSILLKWEGPYSLFSGGPIQCIFDVEKASSPGVYLWAIKHEDGYLVYYIGKGGNIIKRVGYEKAYFEKGNYFIYDPIEFTHGIKKSIYNPRNRNEDKEVANSIKKVKPQIQMMLSTLFVFFAIVDKNEFDPERLERNLIWHLASKTGIVNDFLDNEQIHKFKEYDDVIKVKIQDDHSILGIPNEITI